MAIGESRTTYCPVNRITSFHLCHWLSAISLFFNSHWRLRLKNTNLTPASWVELPTQTVMNTPSLLTENNDPRFEGTYPHSNCLPLIAKHANERCRSVLNEVRRTKCPLKQGPFSRSATLWVPMVHDRRHSLCPQNSCGLFRHTLVHSPTPWQKKRALDDWAENNIIYNWSITPIIYNTYINK